MLMRLLARSVLVCVPVVAAQGPLQGQCEVVKLAGGESTPYSYLGPALAFDGGMLALTGLNPEWQRMIYFFEFVGDDWSLADQVSVPIRTKAYPLILEGNEFIVGDMDFKGGLGRVFSYVLEPSGWSLAQTIGAGAPLSDSDFGRRIALDGDRMVIAAPMYDSQKYRGGAVFLFERVGGQWIEVQKIEPQPAHDMGFFGVEVALEGDLLAVGEPGYFLGMTQDRVYVYRHDGMAWVLEETIEGPQGSLFGYSLDWSQGRLVVGASRDQTHDGLWEGAVHLYEWSGTWQHKGQLYSSHPFGSHAFGLTVAWEEDLLAVGSGAAEILGGERVHLYRRAAGGWNLLDVLAPHQSPYPNGSGFGAGFAFGDGQLWIAAPLDQDDPEYLPGAVYGYNLDPPATPYCGPANPNSTGAAATLRGFGCATLHENDLALEASRLPPQQPAMFLASRSTGFVSQPPGSQGNLCLGGAITRYGGVYSSGPQGFLMRFVDLTALPGPGGILTAYPGETWYFQCWFRDSNPGPTSNLTDGVRVLVRR
jgi:hypothetical protein